MNSLPIFILVETHTEPGKEVRRNADVTFDLVEAELWAAQPPKQTDKGYVEFSFDSFEKPTDLIIATAETTLFLREMRDLKETMAPLQTAIVDALLLQADAEASTEHS